MFQSGWDIRCTKFISGWDIRCTKFKVGGILGVQSL